MSQSGNIVDIVKRQKLALEEKIELLLDVLEETNSLSYIDITDEYELYENKAIAVSKAKKYLEE